MKMFRDNLIVRKNELIPSSSFWKRELLNKYKQKGKKSNIRVSMALNLFHTSLILNDKNNINYSLNILKEESYGNKEHNKSSFKELNKIAQKFNKTDFILKPNYYSYSISSSGSSSIKGKDYPID